MRQTRALAIGLLPAACVLTWLLVFTSSTQALDCAKASTKVETAICADMFLKQADAAMASAYSSAFEAVGRSVRPSLLESQRHWISQRESRCGNTDAPELRAACIGQMTAERTRLLSGAPQSGPGTGVPMVPFVKTQKGGRQLYDIALGAVVFARPASPGQQLFNTQVKEAMAEAPFGAQEDFGRDVPLFYEFKLTIAYASPKLISAVSSIFRYDGGAHPGSSSATINIDLRKGRKLAFSALFDGKGETELARVCRAQLVAQKKDKFGDDGDFDVEEDVDAHREQISKSINDLSRWRFHAQGATVMYDAYEVGSYAEGAYECNFPAARLKQLATNTSLLPQW